MRTQFNRDLITHLQGEGRTVFYSSHLLYDVEPVADEVGILDAGRIIRQAETEALRRDVKQIIISREALASVGGKLKILEERAEGDQVAIVVEGAARALDLLGRDGVEHRVVDLNLDEIFEAYVVGQRPIAAAAAALQLQPI
jgi:ABC-2 type transport system ATP-binding protein